MRDELLAPPPGTLGLGRIEKALSQGQLQVRALSGAPQLLRSARPLGPGETDALLLAEEIGAGLLLTDDADARVEARRRGLRATGTVGLLGQARDEGLVPAALPMILELRRLGQWIGERLVEDVRRQEAVPP